MHQVLLTAHILAAIVTIGWLNVTALLAPSVIRRGDLPVLGVMGMWAKKIGPVGSVVFLLGLWLVGEGGATFSDGWVSASMLLFILATVNGSVLIGGAMRAAGAKIAAGQPATAEAGRVTLLGAVNALILVAITYLMVAKPGA